LSFSVNAARLPLPIDDANPSAYQPDATVIASTVMIGEHCGVESDTLDMAEAESVIVGIAADEEPVCPLNVDVDDDTIELPMSYDISTYRFRVNDVI
jgi:hypothetical protein